MQTILGANGQIAEVLARELHGSYTTDIRLVSRTPQKVNDTDQLFPANLLDAGATDKAVQGSRIAYLTVGLPMRSKMWAEQFPVMMQNVIEACRKHQCKLVFFDNTYMYARTGEPQTEENPFMPVGKKSIVRAKIATMLLDEMNRGSMEAVICRAPEFYGPGKTQSITNTLIFDNIERGKKLKVPLKDNTLRTLIWTPDASCAMALIGNTPDAYNQTWHLPCDDNRLTYKALISLASAIYLSAGQAGQKKFSYTVLKMWMFQAGSLFSSKAEELLELLPRYKVDNIFISGKFKKRFPGFKITSYQEGITGIMNGQTQR
ncbi:MAG TPA: NAD-dependent epimerase/dehydratase family protein [Agriterribacter sp.]|nr:NAD-dependent epimerase/dehydratase family protein [Agriterribacter sp.]HRQ49748.1 NAD-dependent epimerase/dehydratase family protein [Agriterribacter sp.]